MKKAVEKDLLLRYDNSHSFDTVLTFHLRTVSRRKTKDQRRGFHA